MLLISPHTAQDYLVTALPVLAVWLFLWARGFPKPWSLGQTGLGIAAAFLVGVFVPMNLAARVLPIGWLLILTGNGHHLLGTGQIAQVFPRNGVNLFLERECSDFGGYFEQLWNVHFPAGERGTLDLSPRHHLVDVDFCLPDFCMRLPVTSMLWRELRFLMW